MPIYGYRCEECGRELEVFQSMSDAPLKTCQLCGGALRKLLYPVGVQFKGSGFYTTDYRDGGSESKGSDGSSRSEGKSESSGSDGKSESKSSGDSGDKSGGKKPEAPAAKDGD
jgi:putative FmdB family regulatory protein